MLIRSILTVAVLASFVFGAAANADQTPENTRPSVNLTAQIDGIVSADRGFASAGGLGSTRR